MKKIVIFDTAVGTSNIGDEIILDAIDRNMSNIFNQAFALRLATHINNFSAKQMLHKNTKVQYFENADWKFLCGTNLIAQKRFGKINSQWQLYPSNLSIYKNCILVGAGTTEQTETLDFLAKILYKKVLSKTYVHSVRDELSKRVVENLGCRAINTGCPTLWELTPEVCERIPKEKGENCIISVSGYEKQIDKTRDQELLDITLKNYKKVDAWIQTTEDEVHLNNLVGNEKIGRIYSLDRFKSFSKKGNVDYVGTRLHGGVFALQNECRSIIIGIDHRAQGFQETNNLPVVDRNEISNKLENMIHSNLITDIKINQKAISEFKAQFI